MKALVFAYHDMGLTGLAALQRAGFEITAVFSHEDDPVENCWFGSVTDWAVQNNIPFYCPENVNDALWQEKIAACTPDVIFSFYYRRLLSRQILTVPVCGAFNLHGSLLPYYRGRCPVNWVLINGENETGVTLHYMTEKADAGDIVAQRAVVINIEDTARSLYGKLCRQAALLFDDVLPLIQGGTIPHYPQNPGEGSYYGRRTPEDGRIDWHWPAARIYNLIRAVTEPYPGAFVSTAGGVRMIIWWALPELETFPAGVLKPGRVRIENGAVFVDAADSRLRLVDVEISGSRLKEDALGNYFQAKEGELWGWMF